MPGMLFLRQAVGQPAPDFGELRFERCVQLSARRLDQNGAALQGSVGDQWEAAAALARQRLTDARLQLRMDANAADLLSEIMHELLVLVKIDGSRLQTIRIIVETPRKGCPDTALRAYQMGIGNCAALR